MKIIQNLIKSEIEFLLLLDINESSMMKIKFLQIVFQQLRCDSIILRRSIYYEAVPIFKKQSSVDALIKFYTKKFNCESTDLHIRSSLKGIYYGELQFITKDGKIVDSSLGKAIIPYMDEIGNVVHQYSTVLVIEKEAIFDRMKSKVSEKILLICGKGYPCGNTLKLLKNLQNSCNIYCLTDFDPFGLHIFLIYNACINKIRRIGIGYSDLFNYPVKKSNCISLNKYDYRMIEKLKKSQLSAEAKFIEGIGYKMEIEIVFGEKDFDIGKFIHSKVWPG